jgi:ABC-type nickel/cobalt efflux system permease component RcnA
MESLDTAIAHLASGHGIAFVLVVAFVLGLRHASDPDHLVAVSTLVAGTHERASRAAAALGAAWGAGHATTLLLLGVPVIVLHRFVPALVETLAEALVGAIIVALAVRLLVRWRRGAFHTHEHQHGVDGAHHRHLHAHAHSADHAHRHVLRSPLQAYTIGLVHGAAGSGAIAVLIVAAVPTRATAVLALLVLLLGTALAMTALSAAAGHAFGAAPLRRRFGAAIPVLGASALLFGVWYSVAALQAI